MPIIRIITVVVITLGPARGEGRAACKLGLSSGCLAQPTNLHHINLRHLCGELEVLVRPGSPRATGYSRIQTQTDAEKEAPAVSCVLGGRRGTDPPGDRGLAGGLLLSPVRPLCLPRRPVRCLLGSRPRLSPRPPQATSDTQEAQGSASPAPAVRSLRAADYRDNALRS